jgi:hypothetical protein
MSDHDTTSKKDPADETFAWSDETEETEGSSSGGPGATAERMVSQLQHMIDSLATQAAPVARQVGAKAAELAAKAADRAGPIAHKAADATADASVKLASKSRTWAADLRKSDAANGEDATNGSGTAPTATATTEDADAPEAPKTEG